MIVVEFGLGRVQGVEKEQRASCAGSVPSVSTKEEAVIVSALQHGENPYVERVHEIAIWRVIDWARGTSALDRSFLPAGSQ
jgi:hypothetical protein